MKLKKFYVFCLFFSLFLTSCNGKENINSNKNETKKESLSKSLDDMNVKEYLENIELPNNSKDFSFLDFDNENNKIYYSYTKDESIIYESKNLKTNDIEILYTIKGNEKENMFAIAKDGVIDGNLYILKVNNRNIVRENKDGKENTSDKFEYNFIVIDKDKNVKKYMDEDEYILSSDNQFYNKIPSVCLDGHNLILTCENNVKDSIKSYLIKFNIDECNLSLIKEAEVVRKDNKLNGDYIMFAGGLDNTIFYQMIKYDNDDSLEKGSATIYKISKSGENKKIIDLDQINNPKDVKNRKVLFLSGDDKLLFTSDYVIEASNYNTGKVFNLSNTITNKEIPDVYSGYDLNNCAKFENFYFISNNEYLYIYNNNGNLLFQEKYDDKNSVVSKLSFNKNCISFLIKENNDSPEAKLKTIKIEKNK